MNLIPSNQIIFVDSGTEHRTTHTVFFGMLGSVHIPSTWLPQSQFQVSLNYEMFDQSQYCD